MTTEEHLDEIRGLLKTLAVTVAQHDDQIEALITVAEKHDAQIAAAIAADERLRLRIEAIAEVTNANSEQIAATERRWQAYITTLPRQ